VNLVVAHGAGLIFRRLVVHGTAGPDRREGVALQTEHVHEAYFKEPGIGGTVGRVATAATLGLYRNMFVDEGSLLVDVALVADGIAAGQGLQLPDRRRSVRIMAVSALHQALVDAVVIGLGKIRLGRRMAAVAQLGLFVDQEMLILHRMMGRVAVETSDGATGVGGFGKMGLLTTFAVTAQTARARLLA